MELKLNKFAIKIVAGLKKQLGDDYDISHTVTLKNNSVSYTGIVFRPKSQRIAPTIYIDDLYERYETGEISIEDAVREVILRYENSKPDLKAINEFSVEYEECRDKIIFRLISKTKNQLILEHMPYIPFLDMAITFYIVVDICDRGLQTIKITKDLQNKWNISTEQLLKLAMKNTPALLPETVANLQDIVAEFFEPTEFKQMCDDIYLTNKEKIDMIIITNDIRINGASVILYEGVIEKIAEEQNADLFLLPSSIHEMILVPVRDPADRAIFSQMVQSINREYVQDDEILSDEVYIYLKDEKKFV